MGMTGSIFAGAKGAKKVGESMVPDMPDLPPAAAVTAMPDPLAQEMAKKRSIVEQFSRRGRASTVLTNSANKLGA